MDDGTYAYDQDGNLLSVLEPANSAANVAYGYDGLNRVNTETSSGATHTYGYDLAGNRTSVTYGGTGRQVICVYDALNRLSTLAESGRTTNYYYDLNGNLVSQQFPNGDIVTTAFDYLNRRTEIATAVQGGNLSESDLAYDLKGNLLSQQEQYFTQSLESRTVGMIYDGADRLADENITQGAVTLSTTYTYDGANNRSTRLVIGGTAAGMTSYGYNNLNQLTAWSGPEGSASYGYDADGERTSSSQGNTSYGYDDENRMVSMTQNGVSYQYVYDYRTRRVGRTEGGTSTKVVFSGGSSIAEYTSGSSSPTVEYLRGSDWGGGVGGILYTLRDAGATMGVTHYDGRGDVVAKTDGNGVLAYQASYEAFGKRSQEYGSTLDRQKANTKEEDPTGLLDEGMRYRDLETGVFLTRDPAGMIDGPNLYTYVNQNPWTKFDPEGLNSTWGGDNWFANWVLPDPKGETSQASEGATKMFDSSASTSERVSGGLGYLGHGIMAVASMVPGEGAMEKVVEKGAVEVAEKVAETGVKDVTEDSAKAVAEKTEQEVAGDVNGASKVTKPDAKPIDSTRPQHGTADHDATAFNEAKGMQNTPGNTDARFNQQLTNTNGEAIPGFRPDTQVNRTLPDGSIVKDVTEVRSPSQSPADMDAKVGAMQKALGDQAGNVKWIEPTPGVTRNP